MNDNGPNRIDPTPLRISTNVSVDRQTPKTDFGDRVKYGLEAAGSAVASGAAMISPLVPGAGIVSAAISSVGSVTSTPSAGPSYSGGVGSQYMMAAGIAPLTTTASMSPGTGLTAVGGGTGGIPSGGGGGIVPPGTGGIGLPGGTGGGVGSFQDMLNGEAQQQMNMLMMQNQMQQESSMFQTVSNVLKTRYDTAKNSITNIRD